MHPWLHQLWQWTAAIVIPESLAVEATHIPSAEKFESLAPRVRALQPGDLIIVRTPGTFYRFFRTVAGHKFDHLAIVMEDGRHFLHIGPPLIRLLPVELLLEPHRRPLVYRPKLSAIERDNLLASLRPLIGAPYDTIRVYSFVARLAIKRFLGVQQPFAASTSNNGGAGESIGSPKWNDDNSTVRICTDAILNRIVDASQEFKSAAQRLKFDYSVIRSWSINDVQRMRQYKLLSKVRLPRVTLPSLNTLTARQRALAEQRRRALLDGSERWQRIRDGFIRAAAAAWIVAAPAVRTFITAVAITHMRLPYGMAIVARSLAVFLIIRTMVQLRASASSPSLSSSSLAIVARASSAPPSLLSTTKAVSPRSRL